MVVHSIPELTSHREPGVPKIGITRGVTVTDEIVIHAEDVEGGIPGVAFGHVVLLLVEGENACLGVELL